MTTLSADEARKMIAEAISKAAIVADMGDFPYLGNPEYVRDAVIRTLDAAGWQCVPRVATEEMDEAGWIDKEDVEPREIYAAMLAAAPKLVEVKP